MDAIEALGLPDSRWVDIGGPVHYRDWPGPPDGPAFVCVHGLGGSLLNWAPVAPGLARWGRVLALDLAGFGLTPTAGRSAGVRDNRRLLDAFLKELSPAPSVLVGNSMGGMVSLMQAARAPEAVRGLILVDAAFPPGPLRTTRVSPKVAALFTLYSVAWLGEQVADWRARRLGPEGLVRETLRVAAEDPESIDPALRAALVEQARRRTEFDYATPAFLEASRAIFRAQAFPGRYRALVRSVRTPALVIHGQRDRLIPVGSAVEAVRQHPNWTLEILPGIGHVPQMEAPEAWLAAVERWLGGLGDTVLSPSPDGAGKLTPP